MALRARVDERLSSFAADGSLGSRVRQTPVRSLRVAGFADPVVVGGALLYHGAVTVTYFAVRRMRCKYGMRHVLGEMATPRQFAQQRELGERVVAWESRSVKLLKKVEAAVGLYTYGNPGCHAQGARMVNMGGILVDKVVGDAERWFQRERNLDPRVVVQQGDATDDAVLEAGLQLYRDTVSADAVVSFHWGTPSCKPQSSLSALPGRSTTVASGGRGPAPKGDDHLLQFLAVGKRDLAQHGRPFACENTVGALATITEGNVQGIHVARTRELDWGARSYGEHVIISAAQFPVVIPEALRREGDRLRLLTCVGGSTHLPPMGPDRYPLPQPCCDGNILAIWNNGTKGSATKAEVCRTLGIDEDHVTSRARLVDALMPIMSAFVTSALAAMRLAVLQIPYVGYDSALADPRLRHWHEAFLQCQHESVDTRGALDSDIIPTRVELVYVPMVRDTRITVTEDGRLPWCDVEFTGVDVAVEAASRLTLVSPFFPKDARLRFVGHDMTDGVSSLVFMCDFIHDRDVVSFDAMCTEFTAPRQHSSAAHRRWGDDEAYAVAGAGDRAVPIDQLLSHAEVHNPRLYELVNMSLHMSGRSHGHRLRPSPRRRTAQGPGWLDASLTGPSYQPVAGMLLLMAHKRACGERADRGSMKSRAGA